MGTVVLAVYLILVGLIELFGTNVSPTVLGLLALIAGILLLVGDRIAPLVRRV